MPRAFTEKGLHMLATILKSPKAVETTIAIVEAYAKLRELSRVMTANLQTKFIKKILPLQVLLKKGNHFL